MSTREDILQAVLKNQPELSPLPDINNFYGNRNNIVQTYMEVFKSIGGSVFLVNNTDEIIQLIGEHFDTGKRMVTTQPTLNKIAEIMEPGVDPHMYEDVELAIISAQFAVAENGAVWLTEHLMGHRIIPYICQHLAVIVQAGDIVPTLHEAYKIIGDGDYGFAAFIGGPSKTADIEQALVLGAHGPLTMTVFVMQ